MGLKQKFIEDKVGRCRFDDWFIDELLEQPYPVGIEIMLQIQRNAPLLPERMGWSQMVGGVITKNTPLFFEIEYIKDINKPPIYLDIKEIDCDSYLDYINLKQILK